LIPESVIRSLRSAADDPEATAQILYLVKFGFSLITKAMGELAESHSSNPNNEHYSHVFILFPFAA
jgi:hypothetical protein